MSLKSILSTVVLFGTLTLGAQAQELTAQQAGPDNQYSLAMQSSQLMISGGEAGAPSVLVLAVSTSQVQFVPGVWVLSQPLAFGGFNLNAQGERSFALPQGMLAPGQSIVFQSISMFSAPSLAASNALVVAKPLTTAQVQ